MSVNQGHARYLNAIHGGNAKHDTIDAQKIAVLLRGGMRPQASVDPAPMRATGDLLRRRIPLMRTRAELFAHVQHTHSQYNLPDIGQTIAYQATRDGVAERFADPAGHNSIEVALGLMTSYDPLLTDLELSLVKSAKPHDAHTVSRLRSMPGVGKSVALVLR